MGKMSSVAMIFLLVTWPVPGSLQRTSAPHGNLPSFHDSGIINACAGSTVEIPWSYHLRNDEQVEDIQWHFEQDAAFRQLVAVYADHSFVAMPGFTTRVHQFDSAGLMLTGVRVADSGTYTAVVGIHSPGTPGLDSFRQEHFTVYLQIGDTLMTTDGYLHVDLHNEAIMDPLTRTWSIQLRCGVFTYRGDPPIQVEWVKPSQETVSSSDYNTTSKEFYLLVDDPVEGGAYTCQIPTVSLSTACLASSQASKGHASINVDKLSARLMLLESENLQLKRQCATHTCP